MLIHCIQKYVLFIARLKGFYFTYYEGKKKEKKWKWIKKKKNSYCVILEVHCLLLL